MHRVMENPQNVAEWRKRAERLRALAKTTHNATQRQELLDLAQQWDGMASQVEMLTRHGYGMRSAVDRR